MAKKYSRHLQFQFNQQQVGKSGNHYNRTSDKNNKIKHQVKTYQQKQIDLETFQNSCAIVNDLIYLPSLDRFSFFLQSISHCAFSTPSPTRHSLIRLFFLGLLFSQFMQSAAEKQETCGSEKAFASTEIEIA